jgi:ElaB/YqjD/DUF883 family membrane-anchored ribosome-binding protein
MERNEFGGGSAQGSSGASSGMGSGLGDSGNTLGSQGYGAGVSGSSGSGSTAGDGSGSSSGVADRARDIAGTAQEKLADAGSAVREKTGTLKNSLADALETGAEKLRQRAGSGGQLAGATSTGVASLDNGRLSNASESVAGGMKATADWLRDADLDGIKSGLEYQVKEHPGRTLLIAAGVGYLLGKAFRK